MHSLIRTELLIGESGIKKLKNSKVIVFGVGGVGSFALEALTRAGIGEIHFVDDDVVALSNLNRQLVATTSTIGELKIDVIKKRIKDINPEIKVKGFKTFYTKETANNINLKEYDYIIDAIDTITSKILLVENAEKTNTPIICSMGTGNKMDPSKFEVDDIYKTSVCPLAKVMRYELRKRGIKKLKVVYSKEKPLKPAISEELNSPLKSNGVRILKKKRQIPGSISFVPPVSGFILASQVVKDILNN